MVSFLSSARCHVALDYYVKPAAVHTARSFSQQMSGNSMTVYFYKSATLPWLRFPGHLRTSLIWTFCLLVCWDGVWPMLSPLCTTLFGKTFREDFPCFDEQSRILLCYTWRCLRPDDFEFATTQLKSQPSTFNRQTSSSWLTRRLQADKWSIYSYTWKFWRDQSFRR